MKLLQPDLHLLLGIIQPMHQARQDLLILQGIEFHVVNLTRDRVGPVPHDTFHKDVVKNFEEDEMIGGDAGIRECLRLGRRASEAVEEQAPIPCSLSWQVFP